MATTNLIQWNPTAANQENDAAYAADSQRAGGATNPALFDATLANKAFYQWSTFLTALFAAYAAKGFTTSDSNLSTLTAQCAGFLTTADLLAVLSTAGGPLISATQAGAGYGSIPSQAAIAAITQGAATNYLFAAIDSGGNVNFYIQANGHIEGASLHLSGLADVGSLKVAGAAPLGQVLTGDGTTYVPLSPAVGVGIVTTRNANGTFVQSPDGAGGFNYTAWGTVNAAVTGGRFTTATIVFPANFPGNPVVTITPNGHSDGSGQNALTSNINGLSPAGCTAELTCAVNIGGSGSSGFHNVVQVGWQASY